jgi:threonine/homoserine efflux transporter RhtA
MEPNVNAVETVPSDKPEFRHWQSLSDGFLLSLVIVGPTFLLEEMWGGKPLIDRGGVVWVAPAAVMALGFFIGGRIAGRHRRTAKGAFNQGVLVATLTIPLIFIADMVRRIVLHQNLPPEVLGFWVGALVCATLVGGLGGLSGRRRTVKAQKRRQMSRFL